MSALRHAMTFELDRGSLYRLNQYGFLEIEEHQFQGLLFILPLKRSIFWIPAGSKQSD